MRAQQPADQREHAKHRNHAWKRVHRRRSKRGQPKEHEHSEGVRGADYDIRDGWKLTETTSVLND